MTSRRPPSQRDPEYAIVRMSRALQSMVPGSMGGRVANASPIAHEPGTAVPGIVSASSVEESDHKGVGVPSTQVGEFAVASGEHSAAFGTSATAYADYCVAVGDSALAQGSFSTAIGEGALAFGPQCVAIGSNSWTGGVDVPYNDNGVAVGYFAQALGEGTSVVGALAYSNHDFSTAIGYNAETTDTNQLMLGTADETVVAPGDAQLGGTGKVVGVMGAPGTGRQTITGARNANPALASLLTALAGHGWIVDSTTAGSASSPLRTVVTKTTTYTAVAEEVVLASAASGAWVLTLPSATSGISVTVKKTDATANAVTVTPASGTVDGVATFPVTTQYAAATFVSDGTNWFVV